MGYMGVAGKALGGNPEWCADTWLPKKTDCKKIGCQLKKGCMWFKADEPHRKAQLKRLSAPRVIKADLARKYIMKSIANKGGQA